MSLLHLDDDILSLIASHRLDDQAPELDDALSMSLVCKRLRPILLSLLFRAVRWPQRSRFEFYPPQLWPHIRRFSFLQVQWRSHHIKSLETLSNALPQLYNLTTFNYCEQKFGPTLTSISSLASSSPSLTTLELNTVFFSHDALTLFSTFSGLHRLLLRQPEGTTLSTAPESKRALSLQCVANLILACHETLSYLELPGEFCPVESLASGSTTLSALKTLILHGYPPLGAETILIWKASPSMPRLTRLEVLFRLRVVGARASRYVLMPSDVSYTEGDESIFPSRTTKPFNREPNDEGPCIQTSPFLIKEPHP
ncbi:hypothetical protein FPV67DRAFT_612321 [Lyophyllum atratum]|nr:hypothetical protein FPV67DRAFT_612321 [Lyophyllum atratum]